MLKKTITYKDLDGNDITEDFYFSYNKAELIEMKLVMGDGLEDNLRRMIASQDGAALMEAFKKLVGGSVGRRSEDNKRFVKSPEITDAFMQSDAYTTLFLEFFTDTKIIVDFVRGIVPADMSDSIDIPANQVDLLSKPEPKKLEDYTEQELLEMPQDEFNRVAGTNPSKWSHKVLQLAFQRKMQ